MIGTKQLLTVAHAYAKAEDVPLSTVSSRVFDDGKRLDRIEHEGRDILSGSLNRALQWFSQHWPDGADWPEEIPRPRLTDDGWIFVLPEAPRIPA